jgi:hypothetical protein
MRNLISVFGALGACLLFVVCVTAQDEGKKERKTEAKAEGVDLSVKFTKDLKSNYRLSQVTTTKMEVMGEKQHTVSTTDYECEQTCTAIDDDGNATLEMKYTRVVLKNVENEEETVNYDSKKDKLEDLEEGDRLKAVLAGLVFTATVSPQGKVSELKGYDKYKEAVSEKVSEMHAAMLEQIAGDVTMRDAIESGFRALPAEKVAIGDTWEASWQMVIPMMGTAKYSATYTLEEITEKAGRKCAHATMTGELSMESGEDAAFKVVYKDVDWTGDLWIDLKTRETVLSDSTMKFTMEMDMGIKIVAPSEVRTVMELLDPEAAKDKGADNPVD